MQLSAPPLWTGILNKPSALITKSYDSGNQTITSSGPLTLAHGLGAKPSIIFCYLKNISGGAVNNWANGDEFLVAVQGESNNRGAAIYADATNVYVRFGTAALAFDFLDKTTGGTSSTTNTQWALIVRAWA